jgi:hypothetical protein
MVFRALSTAASQLIPAGSSCWQFTLRNGAPHVITAKTDGDWLFLEANYPDEAQRSEPLWDTLARNGSLAGLAKIVMDSDGRLRLRAELPLVEDADLAARMLEACGGFASVWSPDERNTTGDALRREEVEALDLKHLCTEAGWVFTERGGGRLAVELEVPDCFYQGILIPLQRGAGVTCELAAIEGDSEDSRRAIAGLLLAASGVVRMVRATMSPDQTLPVAQLEAVFGTAPSPSEISSALESLSVGCSLCGEELKTLQAPTVAQRYLSLRRWEANPARRRNERTVTRPQPCDCVGTSRAGQDDSNAPGQRHGRSPHAAVGSPAREQSHGRRAV